MATSSTDVLGANQAAILEQLRKEEKRQRRSAVNALAQTAGALDDAALVGVLTVTGDLVGYLPPVTPPP